STTTTPASSTTSTTMAGGPTTTSSTTPAPTTTTTPGTTSTTTTTLGTGPVPPPRDICGNCIDDDRNGLTDFEDPACCMQSQAFTMTVTRGLLRPRGAATRLKLKSLLAKVGLADVNPLKQDVFVQIRPAGGTVGRDAPTGRPGRLRGRGGRARGAAASTRRRPPSRPRELHPDARRTLRGIRAVGDAQGAAVGVDDERRRRSVAESSRRQDHSSSPA